MYGWVYGCAHAALTAVAAARVGKIDKVHRRAFMLSYTELEKLPCGAACTCDGRDMPADSALALVRLYNDGTAKPAYVGFRRLLPKKDAIGKLPTVALSSQRSVRLARSVRRHSACVRRPC